MLTSKHGLSSSSSLAMLFLLFIITCVFYSMQYIWKKIIIPNIHCNFEKSRNVILIIAHPDDEVMFFSPTIHALSKLLNIENLFILSITNGNYDALGHIRKKEFITCCKVLGLNAKSVLILEDSKFPDNPLCHWDIEKLKTRLQAILEDKNVDTIITFGENGVSGHRNHKDTHTAVERLKKYRTFFLDDVNIMRKYISLLDVLYTAVVAGFLQRKLVVVSSPEEVYTSYIRHRESTHSRQS